MDKHKKSSRIGKIELTKEGAEQARKLSNQKGRSEVLKELKIDYSIIIENMLNGFALHEIILDKDGKPCDYRFLYVNPSFEKLTGLKRENIIGKTALEVLPGLEKYWIDTYGKVAMTGKPVQFENFSQSLNKHYWVTAFSPKKGYFTTFFSDITDLKRREEEIIKLLDFQKAVRTINQLLIRANYENNLYQRICDIVIKVKFAKFVWIGLVEKGSFDIKPVASAGPYKDYLSKIKVKWDDSQNPSSI